MARFKVEGIDGFVSDADVDLLLNDGFDPNLITEVKDFTPSKARLDSAKALRAQAASDLKDAGGSTYEEQSPYTSAVERVNNAIDRVPGLVPSAIKSTAEMLFPRYMGEHQSIEGPAIGLVGDLLSLPGRQISATSVKPTLAALRELGEANVSGIPKAYHDELMNYAHNMRDTGEGYQREHPNDPFSIVANNISVDPLTPIGFGSAGIGLKAGKVAYPLIQGAIGGGLEGARTLYNTGDLGEAARAAGISGVAGAILPFATSVKQGLAGRLADDFGNKKLVDEILSKTTGWLDEAKDIGHTYKNMIKEEAEKIPQLIKDAGKIDLPIKSKLPVETWLKYLKNIWEGSNDTHLKELAEGLASGRSNISKNELLGAFSESGTAYGKPGEYTKAMKEVFDKFHPKDPNKITLGDLLNEYSIKQPKDLPPSTSATYKDVLRKAQYDFNTAIENLPEAYPGKLGSELTIGDSPETAAEILGGIKKSAKRMADIKEVGKKVKAAIPGGPAPVLRARIARSLPTESTAQAGRQTVASMDKADQERIKINAEAAYRERLKAEAARLYDKLSTNPDTKKLLSSGTTFGHLSRLLADGTNDSLNSYIVGLRKIDEGYTKSKRSKN